MRVSSGPRCWSAILDGLPDHFVCLEEECWGDYETDGLGGLKIDDQFERRGQLHGQVRRLGAFEDVIRI
jgi:hypothetical protein